MWNLTPLGNRNHLSSSGCINSVPIVFCIYKYENGSMGSNGLHPWRSSRRKVQSSIQNSTYRQRGNGHTWSDLLTFLFIGFLYFLSAISQHESSCLPGFLIFKLSSQRLIIFTANTLCVSLILNYDREVNNLLLLVLWKVITYLIKFSIPGSHDDCV